jgi:BlaI family transcriptional regulator, penicillinase repressor
LICVHLWFEYSSVSDGLYSSHNAPPRRTPAHRRSVLDLAPLELDCMNTLWPLGEATVRDIRDRLAEHRPRAYTTIMTIMDRLARKGVVQRRKSGRAYIYRAHLTADQARTQALAQLIDNFFSGSKEALLAQLATAKAQPANAQSRPGHSKPEPAARPFVELGSSPAEPAASPRASVAEPETESAKPEAEQVTPLELANAQPERATPVQEAKPDGTAKPGPTTPDDAAKPEAPVKAFAASFPDPSRDRR